MVINKGNSSNLRGNDSDRSPDISKSSKSPDSPTNLVIFGSLTEFSAFSMAIEDTSIILPSKVKTFLILKFVKTC